MTRQSPIGRVVFVGAVHEAVPALDAVVACTEAELTAVVTAPLERASRLAGAVDLEPVAQRLGVPLFRTEDINAEEMVQQIAAVRPDLLVVVGWTRLIGQRLLSVPAHGCVGFHASLLPHNRGRAPVNWAIIRGETVTGNTMMLLDAGADTGDIVDQRAIPICTDDTCGTVYERVGVAGAQMLSEHLPALLKGSAPRRRQPMSDEPVLPRRTPEMGVIDWDRPAREVHNWIRGLTVPYPGAYSRISGRHLRVWATRQPGCAQPPVGRPGEVLEINHNGAVIGVRGGSVLVTQASIPGRAPSPSRAVFEANDIAEGDLFDLPDRATAAWAKGEGPRPTGDAPRWQVQ